MVKTLSKSTKVCSKSDLESGRYLAKNIVPPCPSGKITGNARKYKRLSPLTG